MKTVNAGITVAAKQNVSKPIDELIDLPHNLSAGRGGAGYSAITAGSAGLKAVESVMTAVNNPFSASATIGASTSRSSYQAASSSASVSNVTAGRDILAHSGRDISIEGGVIQALKNINLNAGQDLNITSAQNSTSSKFSSSSYGGGVGVNGGLGASGFYGGINAYGNASGALGNNKSVTHNNSLIAAGEQLTTASGRNTTVAGGHLVGDSVSMDVGRNLTVASVQDSYDAKSRNWSADADVTVGYGVNVSASLGFGMGKESGDWVGQQTSIIGRKLVDIRVEDHTHMAGSLIASGRWRVTAGHRLL